MSATLRRLALGLTLLALWVTPYVFPLLQFQMTVGWYVAFTLNVAWTVLLVASMVEELPKLESWWIATARYPWTHWLGSAGPWLVALFGGATTLLIAQIRWPSVSTGVCWVHQVVLIEAGIGAVVPSLVVLVARALKRPIRVSDMPLHRWITAVSSILFMPPFLHGAGFAVWAQGCLFTVGCWTMWVRELPSREVSSSPRKWRVRCVALAWGVPLLALSQVLINTTFVRFKPSSEASLYLLPLFSELDIGSAGLVIVVAGMVIGDAIAWAMRGSRSVRARMIILGLSSAGLAIVLAGMDLTTFLNVVGPEGVDDAFRPALLFSTKLILVGVIVSAFSVTVSRGLSRSLEQSVHAISEIRRGNLDVSLDDSGRDEVAEVARSVNRMVAQLREAEFLERINADLQSRSTRLSQTLDALRMAQAELVRAERMASVATLVKGIAHELNNPINYIAGNMAPLRRYGDFLTRVAMDLSDGRARGAEELRALTRFSATKDLAFVREDLARLTSDIGEGARRAHLIIGDLQSLTSAAERGIERVDLHHVVRQTVALLRPSVPSGARVEIDLAPARFVTARAGQLEQVLVNLTDNALRAVGDGGVVRLAVGEIEGHVFVKVTDTGVGMTAEVSRQAFEPFFTTRAAGDGSGLGLAIVASIIRAHHGTVAISSEPGRGTEVEVRLPLRADTLLQAELAQAPLSAGAQG
jgi:signal transduction histidine kinase